MKQQLSLLKVRQRISAGTAESSCEAVTLTAKDPRLLSMLMLRASKQSLIARGHRRWREMEFDGLQKAALNIAVTHLSPAVPKICDLEAGI